jgi:hypothetical protein
VPHEGGDDRKVDSAIHEVGGEAVPQRSSGDARAQACAARCGVDDIAHVFGRQAAHLDSRPEQRTALATVQQIRQKLGVERRGDGDAARPIALAVAHGKLLAITTDIGNIQGAQLAGAQTAAVEQQHDESIVPGGGFCDRGGVHQSFGFLERE